MYQGKLLAARGSLRTVFVNSEGKSEVRLAQKHHQSTQKTSEIGSTKTLDLPFCWLILHLLAEKGP
jgi:hypothetical protein